MALPWRGGLWLLGGPRGCESLGSPAAQRVSRADKIMGAII